MENLEKIIEIKTTENEINNLVVKYANWVLTYNFDELTKTKLEHKNKLNMLNLQINRANTLTSLEQIKTKSEDVLNAGLKDVNSFVSKVKIAEFNKHTKAITSMLETLKNTNFYNETLIVIDKISVELSNLIDAENYAEELKETYNAIVFNVNEKTNALNNINLNNQKNELEQDKANLALKINNFTSILENFDSEILSSLSSNNKLTKILKDAENYVVKHNIKSNLNPLEYNEYLALKEEFYNTLKTHNDFINVQAITLSNEISEFLSNDTTMFNSKWAEVISNENKKDYIKHIQKSIKEMNALIDNFSVKYGNFVDNIYKDYVEHLVNINFTLLNK